MKEERGSGAAPEAESQLVAKEDNKGVHVAVCGVFICNRAVFARFRKISGPL